MNRRLLVPYFPLVVILVGCGSTGILPHGTGTTTELDRANFRVVASNVRGESQGYSFLGFIPIVSPSISDAMDHLQNQIPSEGRAITLINVVQERRNTYLILFSLTRIIIRADAIEFIDESDSGTRGSR